ncbi:assimilatory nitrate reductase NasA [Halogeometricum limi]|uniref:Assimilatory nitrate reductase catalytic subunit n=1 Tax=Halogeometricum limi TaxID=555875 RepID=A0A1I6H7R0_9EURY|nr:assimilatory nitrate reductase NasA [Halogeometricum limi]SFR50410.1 assimilatory nitrate reductase catalytic subunit [Halogeometricum limi]
MARQVSTTCMRCAVGCGHVHREVESGTGIERVTGDPAHPVSQGLACGRGIRESADPQGEWLTRPLVRRADELVPTTWENAMCLVAGAISDAVETDPDEVAILGSGQQTNEAAYALGKLARGGLGTRMYDANTTLCMASAVTAYYRAFGSDAPPPSYDDVPEAESHVVWGANPAVAHPVLFRWITDSAQDGELVVVDPVETKSVALADDHVAPAPGGDLALARAVLRRLVDTDRLDEAFLADHVAGFDSLRRSLPTVADAADAAGVSVDDVETLAAAFESKTLLYWGMGVNQSVRGSATAGALVDLCLASGNLGPGSGPFSLTGQANSMGTRVCSSKGTWPGHRPFDDPEARERVAEAWDVPVDRLPDDPGPGPVGLLDADPTVLWTVATNPAAGYPNAESVRETLDETFLVVQDAFRTETVEYADVVLPAATWGETEGTAMNMERTVSRVRAATDPPTGVHTDLDIVADVARRVRPGLLPSPRVDPAVVFDEFRRLTVGTKADCAGITYDRLDAEYAVRWPAQGPTDSTAYRYWNDDGSWSFETPSGMARVSVPAFETPSLPETADDIYGLVLTTGREADGYNTGVRSRGGDPGPLTVRASPSTLDAHADALAGGDWRAGSGDDGTEGGGEDGATRTLLDSRRGTVPAVVDVDETVPTGLLWCSVHHPETNRLTVDAVDPHSKEANVKQCAVRLRHPDERRRDSRAVAEPTD